MVSSLFRILKLHLCRPSVAIRLQVASFSAHMHIASTMGLLRFAAASARCRGACSSLSTWLPLQDAPCRLFTSKSDEEPARKNEGNNEESSSPQTQLGELLYARAQNRAMVPRGLLAMTTLHTSYWLWYVLDFTPSLNAAAAKKNELIAAASDGAVAFSGVDSTVGYLGLGMAIMMSLGSAAFPKYLISEIREENSGALRVGVHSLPFCIPQTGSQATVYPPAGVTIDSTADADAIFAKNNGDLTKSRGFLALRATGKRVNFLLNISAEDTMNRPDVLLDHILPSAVRTANENQAVTSGRKKRRKPMDPRRKQQREQRQLRRRQ